MKTLTTKILRLSFLVGLLGITSGNALATAQAPDILIYEGERFALFSNPLESYYNEDNPRPSFNSHSTGNWRGYVATWKIDGDTLYLRDIKAWLNGTEVGLDTLFPEHQGKIEASWFTGKLRVPRGKELSYVHMGYASIYEQDIIISVQAGKVVKTEIIDNSDKIKK